MPKSSENGIGNPPADEHGEISVLFINCDDEQQMMLLTDQQRAEIRRRIADPNRVLFSYEEARTRIVELILKA